MRGNHVLSLVCPILITVTSLPGAEPVAPAAGRAAERAQPNQFTRAPYLQLATPDSMTLVWRTEGPIKAVVRYGAAVEHLDQLVSAPAIVTRVALTTNEARLKALKGTQPELFRLPQLHSAPAGILQYEARITGLMPGTQYYYAVYDGERRLTETDPAYHFVTPPSKGEGRAARFWVVGDSGTGREAQHSVHTAMLDWILRDQRPLDFFLHLGGMALPQGRDVEFQARFFDMYEPTLRQVVCWPTMGDDEGALSNGAEAIGPYYDAFVCPTNGEAGGVPSGTEAFYAFDHGRIHFICLDSQDLDRKPTGQMARWLRRDLEQTRADWIVAFFHHPPYTKGSHDSDREKQLIEMRTHVMPILDSGGVDLVLSSHSRIYERSMLMDGAYATPTVAKGVILDDGEGDPRTGKPYRKSAGVRPNGGTLHVVAGNGGAALGRKDTMPLMRKIVAEQGSVIVDIDGDTLRGTMLNKFGEVRDVFALQKRGVAEQRRLTDPWQPDPWKKPKSPGEEPQTEAPETFLVVIPKYSEWTYLAGEHPNDTQWTEPGFDARNWRKGEAPFGYEYKEARTDLREMKGNSSVVYLRHEFQVQDASPIAELGLMINYDDGFIAYLNGVEVLRKGVGKGSGSGAQQVKSHDALRYSYFPIKDFEKHLRNGRNVLAIEGHNSSTDSHDLLIDPWLLIER